MSVKNLLILCGGISAEHEISLKTARYIAQNIDQDQYNVIVVIVGRDRHWSAVSYDAFLDGGISGENVFLIRHGDHVVLHSQDSSEIIDMVFPAIHGTSGEDGSIQGMLEYVGVPYVGNGILASAVGMDKIATKLILQACQLPVVPFLWAAESAQVPSYDQACQLLNSDVLIIKAACSGSSIGVYKVSNSKQYQEKVQQAFRYSTRILIEQAITGAEVECAILGNNQAMASGIGEIKVQTEDGMYSYQAKYHDPDQKQAEVFLDAPSIDAQTTQQIQTLAKRAFQALDGSGLARVDFFVTKDGILINEINTMPGFTSISLYPKLWEKSGIPNQDLIAKLLDYAQQRFDRRSALIYTPES
jgi:D-alanine-D-alanine ligase